MYMIGQLKRTTPSTVSFEEAVTPALALAIQRQFAAASIRLAPTAASVVAQLCTSSKNLRRFQPKCVNSKLILNKVNYI